MSMVFIRMFLQDLEQINNSQVLCNVSTVFLIFFAFGHKSVSFLERVVSCCRMGRNLAYPRSNSLKIKYCLSNCHPEECFVLSNGSAFSQAVIVKLGPLEAGKKHSSTSRLQQ